MAQVVYESIIEQVRQLPFPDRQRLLESLAKEIRQPNHNGGQLAGSVSEIDRTRESEWLKKHSQEYAGKWVALSGDQLIASGDDGVATFNEAIAKGVDRPLLVQVESADAHPFGFWL